MRGNKMKDTIKKFGIRMAGSIDDYLYYIVKGRMSSGGDSINNLSKSDLDDLFTTIYKSLIIIMNKNLQR